MSKFLTLFLFLLLANRAFAQIPNASFENWTSVTTGTGASAFTYRDPVGWGTFNAVSSIHRVTTCDSEGAGSPFGAAYVALTAKILPTSAINTPGMLVTGSIHIIDSTSVAPFYYIYSFSGGFPIATRPASLEGIYQFGSHAGDRPHIAVFLWKWNTATHKRDTVAALDSNFSMLTGSIPTWTSFSMPLKYLHGDTPDSGFVLLSTSGAMPVDGSTLNVDGLSFTGSVPNGVASIAAATSSVAVYPNPASGRTSIHYQCSSVTCISVTLSDIAGQTMMHFDWQATAGENDLPLNLRIVPRGLYVIKLTDENGTIEKKLSVQ